jgi:hypothetical protein
MNPSHFTGRRLVRSLPSPELAIAPGRCPINSMNEHKKARKQVLPGFLLKSFRGAPLINSGEYQLHPLSLDQQTVLVEVGLCLLSINL